MAPFINSSTAYIPLVAFFIGLTGSLHCVAMCGAFATSCSGDKQNVITYQLGRLISYSLLGIVAGILGQTLQVLFDNPYVKIIPGVLLGLFLIFMGLKHWGVKFKKSFIQVPFVSKLLQMSYQRAPGNTRSLLIGLLSAFLPCGFLYSVLISLAIFHDPYIGFIGMFSFCLGTMPALVLSPQIIRKVLSPLKNQSQLLSSFLLISLGLVTIFYRVIKHYESIIQCQ